MTLSMTHCIGRASCVNAPTGGRGLCASCYSWHRTRQTLGNFPTMRERADELRRAGMMTVPDTQRRAKRAVKQAAAASKWRNERRAERVLLNGHLVHPNAPHGRLGTYTTFSCRGPLCYAAWRHYKVTGECFLPDALYGRFTAEQCATHRSDVYPDNR